MTDSRGGPPVLGTYYYGVSLQQQFETTIVSKGGSFVLGDEDVDIHVEFVLLTIPVAWTITQGGEPRSCEDVGATQLRFRYKQGRRTTRATIACSTASSSVLFPLEPATYEDIGAELLDAEDNVIASWDDVEPYVLTEEDLADFPSPRFAL